MKRNKFRLLYTQDESTGEIKLVDKKTIKEVKAKKRLQPKPKKVK